MTTKTILIADDDYELVEVLAMRCRQLGLNVLPAYDGISALRIIDEKMPDLICLDVNMPLGNGLGVCEMMAPDKQLASIPVIVLTGRSDDQTISQCRSMGAHYLHKSFDVWGLLRPMLYELLNLGNPKPDNAEPNDPGERDAAGWDDLAPVTTPRCLTHLIEVVTHGDSHR
ncbi:MAG: response regulator [Candidatus Nealsonbacteria bacterium]|nr:response regulator [Candidatus Nealsonbacteria bacterium]